MRNEVRIPKTFLKSNEIMVQKIAKQELVDIEVLVLHFGNFENIIKSISKIEENQLLEKLQRSLIHL